ncbi:helix-turn-helix domain-containing protein [Paenibacillus sp. LPE1-1-1.1]|uniref:helix-turn-helix domain-containing protein n=1 Tax=Paenibacillus sp. LPE1-1-1.1 TaxID=3135230 RepID=UPI00343E7DF0
MRVVYTVKELSQLLGISKDSIYAMVREHQIPHIKLRKRILFHSETIDKWLRESSAVFPDKY